MKIEFGNQRQGLWASVFIICLIVNGQISTEAKNCKKIDDCSCEFDDGSGRVDIRGLGKQDGTPAFSANEPNNYWNYQYNPCYPFSQGAYCQNVAVCQKSSGGDYGYPIGRQDSAEWSFDPKTQQVQVQYSESTGLKESTIVTWKCDPGVTGDATYKANTGNTSPYTLTVTHASACPSHNTGNTGISGGTVLIIVFVVLLLVYVIAGIIFNKVRRQASGAELIPNANFWKGFPFLVKDGAVFVFTGCKTDRIYKNLDSK
ncbi:uncharacterized protein LOC106151385 [Lingula anatina]|uniref:Autophagy-related protein 27 n=1 Tax=Lingula anatina TaxID=7574 RepID=A0A1S3H1R9_LINAN|nr:uncharacterized protein LOC106151385 [Lingula anatina]|eukprot:XP_013380070.1 uncharacterized protein LOC106151385 [Lingula anatina]